MATTGAFGFKIGKKTRLMHIESHADILWQTCVREIYILMKHYGTIDALYEAFKQLKDAKGKPKHNALEKCKYFADIHTPTFTNTNANANANANVEEEWQHLLKYCQHSYINILESGYFLNDGEKAPGNLIFLLDFNTNSAFFFKIDQNGKEHNYEKATIDEIMVFEDMPTTSLTTILETTKEHYNNYRNKFNSIDTELCKIQSIINKTREMGADQNIITKAGHLLETLNWERKRLEMEYRFFYNRLSILDLIDHEE